MDEGHKGNDDSTGNGNSNSTGNDQSTVNGNPVSTTGTAYYVVTFEYVDRSYRKGFKNCL